MKQADYGIITIRDDEFRSVLKRFPPHEFIQLERAYNIHNLHTRFGVTTRVAILRCREPGNTEAQNAAHDMISEINPDWIVVVGIAGGVPHDDFTLGDVIVSTRIHDFCVEAALQDQSREFDVRGGAVHKAIATVLVNLPALEKELEGWNSDSSIGRGRPRVTIRDDDFYGGYEWISKVKKSLKHHFSAKLRTRAPRVLGAPIASSDRLMKDHELLKLWLGMARQIHAIEMESAGVYHAAQSAKGDRPIFAIRGISDVVGYKRRAEWTAYACESAAAFAHAFLRLDPALHNTVQSNSNSQLPQFLAKLQDEIESERRQSLTPYSPVRASEVPDLIRKSKVETSVIRNKFVTPKLETRSDAPRGVPQTFETTEKALKHFKEQLVLVGQPGAGKSTTLYEIALEKMEKISGGGEGTIPILLRINTWPAACRSISDWVTAEYAEYSELIKQLIRQNDILFLLDGLDELYDDSDSEDFGNLNPRKSFLSVADNELIKLRFIITSREQEYEGIPEKLRANGGVRLLPFSGDQVQEYLREFPAVWAAAKDDAKFLELLQRPIHIALFRFILDNLKANNEEISIQLFEPAYLGSNLIRVFLQRRHIHEKDRLEPSGRDVPYSVETLTEAFGMMTFNVLRDKRSKSHNVFQKEFLESAGLLAKEQVSSFIDFCTTLGILIRDRNPLKGFRFSHMMFRDYFARLRMNELLIAGSPAERASAVRVAGAIRDIDSISTLSSLLDADSDEDVRSYAARSLSLIDPIGSIGSLVKAVRHDSSGKVRAYAAKALGRIKNDSAKTVLKEVIPRDTKLLQMGVLSTLGESFRPIAMDILSNFERYSKLIVDSALIVLGVTEEGSVYRLIENTHSEDRLEVILAVLALGHIEEANYMKHILWILKSKAVAGSDDVRHVAIYALGRTEHPEAVKLLESLAHDSDPVIALNARNALRRSS